MHVPRSWLALLGLLLPLSLGVQQSVAATINAATCTPTDVQAAHTAAANGDTIQLPTCNVSTWNSTVTITKNVKIKGQGTANTIINRQAVSASFETNVMFNVSGTTGVEFSDFTLNGTQDTNPGTWVDTGILFSNGAVDFHVHHMRFQYFWISLEAHGDPTVQRGVIDHNTFEDFTADPAGTGSDPYGYGVLVIGTGSYPALTLGTSQNVFIEDNTFLRGKSAVQTGNGSRYVFRYNQVLNPTAHHVAIDNHGHTGAWPHGGRQYEVYNNTIDIPASPQNWYQGIRAEGGDGVIFNNTIDANYVQFIALENASPSAQPDCAGPYPMPDQILETYIWGNTLSGGGTATVSNACPSLILLNRDYFLSARPGYTPYTYPHPATLSAAPTVTITTNCGGGVGGNCTVTTSPLTTLAGTASDDVSVSSVTWACDVCGSGTATGTTSWSVASIALMPGPNVITVTATDGDAQQATDTITVSYNAPDDYATGLLMHLPFENGSGTTASDISGQGHPGTLTGGVTWTPGKVGSFAVTLNGTTQQVDVTGLLGTPGAITLAAWVNLTALPDTSNNVVTLGDYVILRQTATTLECAYYYGASWQTTSASASLVGAGWHHLVCAFGPGAQGVYLDGVSVATGTSSNAQVWTGLGSNTVLGNHGFGASRHLQGSLDSVRVYGRALRDGDVTALYLAENQALAAPTVLRLVR